MLPKHPWAGESHHVLDLFASVPLIAMDWAFRAGWLIRTKPAMIQPQADVPHQALTLSTQRVAVLLATVDVDHGGNRFPLAREAALRESIRGQGTHC
jgi:hypothetical protein